MYSLLSLPTIFHAPLHTSTVRLGYTFPTPHTWGAPPQLRPPSHSLPLPHQIQRIKGRGMSPASGSRDQGSGAEARVFLPQPFHGCCMGVGGGEGTGRSGTSGGTPLRLEERRRSWSSRAGGREERRCVENEGPIPDASLWLPQPPASRNPTAGTEGGREDPALSPFPALPTKANELPALPSPSHGCDQ